MKKKIKNINLPSVYKLVYSHITLCLSLTIMSETQASTHTQDNLIQNIMSENNTSIV